MNWTLIIGLAGMAFILLAFMLNVFKRLESHSPEFLWLNFAGSALLTGYAIFTVSVPFLILNAVWSVVALWGIMHHSSIRKEVARAKRL